MSCRGDRLGPLRDMLITHGESGRSGVGRTRNVVALPRLAGQFEQPYGPRAAGPAGRPGDAGGGVVLGNESAGLAVRHKIEIFEATDRQMRKACPWLRTGAS